MATQTQNVNLHFPRDIMDGMEAARGALPRTQYVLGAVAEKNGQVPCGTCRYHADRADRAEAGLREAQAELAELRAQLAEAAGLPAPRETPAPRSGSREDALIAALMPVPRERPARTTALAIASGYTPQLVNANLTLALERGHVVRPSKGYYYVPEGVTEDMLRADFTDGAAARAAAKRAARQQAARQPQGRAQAPGRPRPGDRAAARRAAPAARTQPPAPAAAGEVEQLRKKMEEMESVVIRMATEKYQTPVQERVALARQAARDAGHDLKVASELTAPLAAPFKAPPIPLIADDYDEDEDERPAPRPGRKRGR